MLKCPHLTALMRMTITSGRYSTKTGFVFKQQFMKKLFSQCHFVLVIGTQILCEIQGKNFPQKSYNWSDGGNTVLILSLSFTCFSRGYVSGRCLTFWHMECFLSGALVRAL